MKTPAYRQGLYVMLTMLCAVLATGCKEDEEVYNTYSNLPAKFTMQNTLQAPALHNALNNMGEFCTVTITKDGKQFMFKGSGKEPSYVNITAENDYNGFYLGLSGLVIGLPNIPEMGKDNPSVICFDLACSNCYEKYHITKPLGMQDAGYAHCSSCNRTYNLNDGGIVSSGEGGVRLYRYRVNYYPNNTLVVNNG